MVAADYVVCKIIKQLISPLASYIIFSAIVFRPYTTNVLIC